ncbi:unnamed protein product [Eruca vesicaria subsp. sativa]|uniref:Uncharacterized protein n=1 Tax=Eruca vesicaria subsp. sativa TaxID=29727 RepID=A0ABC8JI34_ERUVS|nr:unnamed protein product [Eruca vesicaria subsp. sativa]
MNKVSKTSVASLVELNMLTVLGGFNAHASNIVSTVFLATGQGPAKLVAPNKVSAFIPDPARVYGCRVLELTKNGISEDDAMSVANMEYLAERKEKKKAYIRLKELAVLQDKAPPPKPYLSPKRRCKLKRRNHLRILLAFAGQTWRRKC